MVNAFACANKVVLGQVKTSEKSNEITAIPELIQLLDVQDTLVSIDAMGCQTSIAEQIVKQGGDYLFTLKSNQGKLCKAVEDAFTEIRTAPLGGLTFEQKRGRIEARTYHVLSADDVSKAFPQWPELKTLRMGMAFG